MPNAAETIALPSPTTQCEDTLPQSMVGGSDVHAVYRGGSRSDVTTYGAPRPSPVHVHGESDWPDEAPTIGLPGGRPRAHVRLAPAPVVARSALPVAPLDPAPFTPLPRAVVEVALRPAIEAPLVKPVVSSSRRVRAYRAPSEGPMQGAISHSRQLELRRPSPRAVKARMPTVRYMPEPETVSVGLAVTSLLLTAALLTGCIAGIAAFQLLIG